ncbi:hypothetical protein [Dictyobacter formicarum]|uniref:Uncharacterized protein n=1 Tax=Dictyobacter formicarum TaxID=2778368 RepID=A0ABQ3VRJ0_9CHLR|nr:hypothetical protein [Dictyobacter formicarum]GHO88208.1 hypothetical protein KSZ_62140 [Dictyobacter formicarum]
MSRYTFCGQSPRYRIITGYDPALSSLFAQVEDLAFETRGAIINEHASIGDNPEEGLLIWVGADAPITDVHDIEKAIAAYSTIPQDILVRLQRDQERHGQPPENMC